MKEESERLCIYCKGRVPKKASHFSNEVAMWHGFCQWSCWLAKEGNNAFHCLAKITKKRSMKRRFKHGKT